MPRYSADKKEQKLKLRLNDEMRSFVENESNNKGMNMSEYLRHLIDREMKRKQ